MLKLHVSRLDKYTDNKFSVTNFRPVSVLNIFPKIYEKNVKDFLVSKMEHHFFSHHLFPHTRNPSVQNMSL